jgi:hypothetical protein
MAKAFQLGFDYEKTYRGCFQCTIAAIQDTLDIREDKVFKAATMTNAPTWLEKPAGWLSNSF